MLHRGRRLIPTIETLLARPAPPDHIVIETSGLALPKPLVLAFNWPEIRTRVTVDGVIAVIDGAAVADGRFADESLDHDNPLEEVFADQLNCADLVILNKADLLAPGALARMSEALAERLRPEVKLIRARHGAVDAAVLLGLGAAVEADLDARPSCHDDDGEHEHDDFESFVVRFGEIASPDGLRQRLAPAIAGHDILRIKGFVAVAGRDMRLLVQGVGGRLQHYFDRDWRAGEPRESRLVVIGRSGLDRAAIAAAIAPVTD